jgi:3-deoxy-7-phosphoheptulonate synthase
MIVVMKPRCSGEHVDHVVGLLNEMGTRHCIINNPGRTVVEVVGASDAVNRERLVRAPMVDRVVDNGGPILAVGGRPDERGRVVPLGGQATVGGVKLAIVAGPCSVETQGQVSEIAAAAKEAGAVALRGGAFKPRTSPYSFQGLGEPGLKILARAREETGLAIVTEVMSPDQVDMVSAYADVLQVGSRNMHSAPLLTAVGRQSKPVLLKRGWSATLEEFLLAAEYIMQAGNQDVILCERGIRTHERYVRNTLALAVVPEIKRVSPLPIIVDPSHGTGRSHLVRPMSHAAVACGADGLLVEIHGTPEQAWSDGEQSLPLDDFRSLMKGLRPIAEASGRTL